MNDILFLLFQYNDFFENRKLVNWKEWKDHPERREKDIVWILAKIKAKVKQYHWHFCFQLLRLYPGRP